MAAFKCKIENNSTHDLIIKIVGAGIEFNVHLNKGDSLITPPGQFLVEGERVAVGWDDFDETIVAFGKVVIDKKKRIKFNDGSVTGSYADTVLVEDDSNL
jgi:hypothetical protein